MFAKIQFCLVLSLLVRVNTCTYRLQHAYKVRIFYIKTIRYSFLLDNNYKFTANVREKDHKITILLHSINIRMLH